MVIELKKSLYVSSACHAAALLFLLISPYLPFQPYRPRPEKVTWITLPKGVGYELGSPLKKAVDLPKTTIQEQKKIAPPAEAKKPSMTVPAKPEAKKPPAAPRQKSEEELRMEKILANASQEVAARKPAVPEAAQIPNTPPGGVPSGVPGAPIVPLDDPERIFYQLKLREKILDEWFPPQKLRDPNLGLICILAVRINERGEVIETKWEQRSAHPAFDDSAERAAKKASPLPPPPERLKWEAFHEGIEIKFSIALLKPEYQ